MPLGLRVSAAARACSKPGTEYKVVLKLETEQTGLGKRRQVEYLRCPEKEF